MKSLYFFITALIIYILGTLIPLHAIELDSLSLNSLEIGEWGIVNTGWTGAQFMASICINEYTSIVVGSYFSNGIILISQSSGTTWRLSYQIQYHPLNDIKSYNNTLYAVGSAGILLYSIDTGSSWSIVTTGYSNDFYSVQLHANVIWISGSNQIVLRSSLLTPFSFQGWENFSPNISSWSGYSLYTISTFDGLHLLAGGDFGFFVQSSNGGQSWTDCSLTSSSSIYSILQINSSVILLLGDTGLLARSINGGASFTFHTDISSNVNFYFHVASAVLQSPSNDNLVYIGSSNGTIWRSLDSGGTWSLESSLPYRLQLPVQSLSMVSSYIGIAGDNNGNVFVKVAAPSSQPSSQPSVSPTMQPSCQPISRPSAQPSSFPSFSPTSQPSRQPTSQPISLPTNCPTSQPIAFPSSLPTKMPTTQPSSSPISCPTSCPSSQPSLMPSVQPSTVPTRIPSSQPFGHPTSLPSKCPSSAPSMQPSSTPTLFPSGQPSRCPTSIPSTQPSICPSSLPSSFPSLAPTIPLQTRVTLQSTLLLTANGLTASQYYYYSGSAAVISTLATYMPGIRAVDISIQSTTQVMGLSPTAPSHWSWDVIGSSFLSHWNQFHSYLSTSFLSNLNPYVKTESSLRTDIPKSRLRPIHNLADRTISVVWTAWYISENLSNVSLSSSAPSVSATWFQNLLYQSIQSGNFSYTLNLELDGHFPGLQSQNTFAATSYVVVHNGWPTSYPTHSPVMPPPSRRWMWILIGIVSFVLMVLFSLFVFLKLLKLYRNRKYDVVEYNQVKVKVQKAKDWDVFRSICCCLSDDSCLRKFFMLSNDGNDDGDDDEESKKSSPVLRIQLTPVNSTSLNKSNNSKSPKMNTASTECITEDQYPLSIIPSFSNQPQTFNGALERPIREESARMVDPIGKNKPWNPIKGSDNAHDHGTNNNPESSEFLVLSRQKKRRRNRTKNSTDSNSVGNHLDDLFDDDDNQSLSSSVSDRSSIRSSKLVTSVALNDSYNLVNSASSEVPLVHLDSLTPSYSTSIGNSNSNGNGNNNSSNQPIRRIVLPNEKSKSGQKKKTSPSSASISTTSFSSSAIPSLNSTPSSLLKGDHGVHTVSGYSHPYLDRVIQLSKEEEVDNVDNDDNDDDDQSTVSEISSRSGSSYYAFSTGSSSTRNIRDRHRPTSLSFQKGGPIPEESEDRKINARDNRLRKISLSHDQEDISSPVAKSGYSISRESLPVSMTTYPESMSASSPSLSVRNIALSSLPAESLNSPQTVTKSLRLSKRFSYGPKAK